MKIEEQIKMTGRVCFRVYENGVLVEDTEQNNLIVNGGKASAAALVLLGSDSKTLTKVGFGTSNTAASPTDTGLTSVYMKTRSGTDVNGTTAEIYFSLEQAEYNGNSINEMGLFCDDGTLFSRIVRTTPIVKNSTIRLDCIWKLTF